MRTLDQAACRKILLNLCALCAVYSPTVAAQQYDLIPVTEPLSDFAGLSPLAAINDAGTVAYTRRGGLGTTNVIIGGDQFPVFNCEGGTDQPLVLVTINLTRMDLNNNGRFVGSGSSSLAPAGLAFESSWIHPITGGKEVCFRFPGDVFSQNNSDVVIGRPPGGNSIVIPDLSSAFNVPSTPIVNVLDFSRLGVPDTSAYLSPNVDDSDTVRFAVQYSYSGGGVGVTQRAIFKTSLTGGTIERSLGPDDLADPAQTSLRYMASDNGRVIYELTKPIFPGRAGYFELNADGSINHRAGYPVTRDINGKLVLGTELSAPFDRRVYQNAVLRGFNNNGDILIWARDLGTFLDELHVVTGTGEDIKLVGRLDQVGDQTVQQLSIPGGGTCCDMLNNNGDVVVRADYQSGLKQILKFVSANTDTEPPNWDVPVSFTVNTDPGLATAVVPYTATATDNVGVTSSSCSPASESTFVLGDTVVSCTASDAAGNTAEASFTVTVVDAEPPVWDVPADIVEVATGLTGATVTYTATATDNVGIVGETCSPGSGSEFPLGDTVVQCEASDAAGNQASASFVVSIVVDGNSVSTLSSGISELELRNGIEQSLLAELRQIERLLTDGNPDNDVAICDKLDEFLAKVEQRLTDGDISSANASLLTEFALALKALFGCG